MPKGYNKLDPADFRRKLKNGEYKDLTGAKRAIGKMQGWSEADRDKSRAAAAKHFGEEAPAPAAKTSKKKASKKSAKKAVKKAAKKASPGPGPGRGRKKKTTKKAAKAAKPAAPKPAAAKPPKAASPKKTKTSPSEVEARIENTRNAVQAYAEAVDVLRKCQGEGHSINDGLAKAAAGVTQLIEAMDRSIVQPLAGFPSAAEQKGAELLRRSAPAAVTPDNGSSQTPVIPPTASSHLPGVVPPTYVPPQV